MEFADWLVAKKLSPSTVKKYVSAIDGALTSWANANKITSKALRDITDRDEFESIAELIGDTEVFHQRNRRGNNMYGAALNNYSTFLAHEQDLTTDADHDGQSLLDSLGGTAGTASYAPPFEPNSEEDARKHTFGAIVRRQGQPKFRIDLISAYEGRCAITGCPIHPILEAAHVTPYLGPHTNAISNGLLLRADIHTLWDLQLIAIDPNSMTVRVSPTIQDPSYQALAELLVYQPAEPSSRVSPYALARQWELFQAQLDRDL